MELTSAELVLYTLLGGYLFYYLTHLTVRNFGAFLFRTFATLAITVLLFETGSPIVGTIWIFVVLMNLWRMVEEAFRY